MKFIAYIDLHNLYYSLHPRKMDYTKLVEYLNGYGEGTIRAYGHQLGSEATTFIEMLTRLGVVPVYRKPIVIKKDAKSTEYKSNWAVGITLDAVQRCDEVELVIIVTDSSEYDLLIEYLQSKGKTVVVIGNNPSRSLRMVADHTHLIPRSMLL